ncbi:Acetyl-CoA acetyltransferase OS=Streptomyces aurantiogriseus OX=66870 GN=GCM10010251_24160 PE=4 SV=1 [Streptomyces aurantiogriseus]
MFRDRITIDDVLSGPMIADPFTKLHCCIRSDGGVRGAAGGRGVRTGHGEGPRLDPGHRGARLPLHDVGVEDFTVSPAAVSGRLAFEQAGVRPATSTWRNVPSAFTYMTLVTLEDLGFCAKGEGGAFVEKGRTGLRGGLPR